ncbi:MAG: hypothetical protein P8P42_10820, partial [Gammaproteobacteria bacterium]|nr:hypothetical protein [Gammaproteobacteria bacterium]
REVFSFNEPIALNVSSGTIWALLRDIKNTRISFELLQRSVATVLPDIKSISILFDIDLIKPFIVAKSRFYKSISSKLIAGAGKWIVQKLDF